MTNENKVKAEAKKTITFDNSLTGKITIDRDILVKNIEVEHRSYANHPCTIENTKTFNLPELSNKYPSGFSIGVVVYLKDNANGESRSKVAMEL